MIAVAATLVRGAGGLVLFDVLLVGLGVALLYGGGEALVRGAMALASRLGVSPLAIGLTVVAFATSAPELAATLAASFRGAPALAIGNVVGSNIANIGLILGSAALIRPLVVGGRLVRREVPMMLLASLLVFPAFSDGEVSRPEGLVLFTLLVVVVRYQLRGEGESVADDLETPAWGWPATLCAVGGGLLLLVVGAQVLVSGAVSLARAAGIGERVIGLSLVAVGTSLPELASSLVAARKGASDIVLGNVVGSNIFNILCILGVTSMVRPLAVPAGALGIDFWVMLGFSVAMVPILSLHRAIGRGQGVILLVAYFGYMVWLFASP